MMDPCVISLGSINLDVQVRTQRWAEPGETLMADESLLTGGGKGANVALIARRLGKPARLLGQVGEDPFADLALAGLRETGVDVTGVGTAANGQTGVSLVITRPDADKNIFLAANANGCWPDDALERVRQVLRAVHPESVLVCDLEVPAAVVSAALAEAKQRGLTTVVDPSPAAQFQPDWAPRIDYLTPNRSEMGQLLGQDFDQLNDLSAAIPKLRELGVNHVLAKGSEGQCVLIARQEAWLLQPPQVEVRDKTGAGDACAGALAAALVSGETPIAAARWAVAAASLAVTRFGSQRAYPTGDEHRRFLPRISLRGL